MNIFILVIVIIIAVFASLSLHKEIRNYLSGYKIARAKRRIIIGVCLLIEGAALMLGFVRFFTIPHSYELLFWVFTLLLLIPIIWLTWIDLKANLREIEKSAIDDMKNLILEIKQDAKKNNKYHN